jgi:NADP-dependent 3-hydroxy acid dehydrogenase YdfG
MKRERILIAGATSALAQASARCFAAEGAELFLAGRNPEHLENNAQDLRLRGAARVECFTIDFDDLDRHAALLDAAKAALGGIDIILVAWGGLPDQAACEADPALAQAAWHSNATATVNFLELAAGLLERQKSGSLAVIGSVAGDRGRRGNYLYGAAKAAVHAYSAGLRARLFPAGVRVVTIKPGLIDSPMTAHLDKGPLFTSSERAGALLHRAIRGGRFQRDLVYLPFWWEPILLAIRILPEAVMKRLNLSA